MAGNWLDVRREISFGKRKLLFTVAGIEGIDAFPVAEQLPPQNGRSFADNQHVSHLRKWMMWNGPNSHPVSTKTGP